MGKSVLAEVDPRDTGSFTLPEQAEWMLYHLMSAVSSALRPDVVSYWFMHKGDPLPEGMPDYRNQDEKDRGISLGWDHLQERRNWFNNATNGAHLLGRLYNVDTRVILRFNRFVHGCRAFNDGEREDLDDALWLLMLAARQAGDGPDSEDDSAYVPASWLYPEKFKTYRKFEGFLEGDGKDIRRRKPSKNRLLVHAGDWVRCWASKKDSDSDIETHGVDSIDLNIVQAAAIQAAKRGRRK